ncbi:MAG: adenosine deaminase family protein [Spirochaetes bacterium]|nr:adenosine deaminase family protein [Spirochaetota bacterium]
MNSFSPGFIKKIPKTDLHVHLDGSLRLQSLIELAKQQKVELPSYTQEGLNEIVFKPEYASLDEYLKGFAYTCAILQDKEALERSAYELAMDSFSDGVRYLEVRFAPQLHVNAKHSIEDVLKAVDSGLKMAKKEINGKIKDPEPTFEYGIIVCAMRFFNKHFSKYYKWFVNLHKYSNELDRIRLASLELAKAAIAVRDSTDVQLVGFDLAGSEYGYPADNHKQSYAYVHKNFLMKTVHAGEAYGPESIFQAITKLHANRIGHGLFLFDVDKICSDEIQDKGRYVDQLANYIAEKRITIEVCLTSNLQTVPEIKSIKDHPFGRMLKEKLSTTFCTDNRLISHTTVTGEINLALNNFTIDEACLKSLIIYGFKRSFFHRPYYEKREYVRKVIDWYEKIQKEEGPV